MKIDPSTFNGRCITCGQLITSCICKYSSIKKYEQTIESTNTTQQIQNMVNACRDEACKKHIMSIRISDQIPQHIQDELPSLLAETFMAGWDQCASNTNTEKVLVEKIPLKRRVLSVLNDLILNHEADAVPLDDENIKEIRQLYKLISKK